MTRRPRLANGTGKLIAALTVALMIVQILVPAAPALLPGEDPAAAGGDSSVPDPAQAPAPGDEPTPGGDRDTVDQATQEADVAALDRARSPLSMVANASGTDAYTGSDPVSSPTLGITAPPEALAARYVQKAATDEHALRSAILAWNEALKLRPQEDVLDDPDLYEADELSQQVQVPAAALLYALTDASLLQGQSLEALDDEDLQALLGSAGTLLDPSLESTDPAFAEAMDELATVGSGVDMGKIQQASRIVTATLEHVRPALEDWKEDDALAEQRSQENLEALEAYTDTYAPEKLEEMHRVDRLDALVEGMRLGAQLAGAGDAVPTRPTPVDADGVTLSEAIAGVASAADAPVDEAQLSAEQERAEALPEALKDALTRVLVAYEGWFEAASASVEDAQTGQAPAAGDPMSAEGGPPEGEVLAAQQTMLATVREVAPTLEAFGLLYGSHAHAMMPTNPGEMPRAVPGLAEIGAMLTQPEKGISSMTHAGSMLQGAELTTKPQPELPPEGALEDLVLDLYDRYNLVVNASTRQALATGVDNLPAPLERNSARVLEAQLSATDRLTELYRSLNPDEQALLASGASPQAMQQAVLDGDITTDQLDRLETYHDLLAKTLDAYYKGSLEVALALDASQRALDEWRAGGGQASTQSARPAPADGASWRSTLGDWASSIPEALSVLSPVGTAAAQTPSRDTYANRCHQAQTLMGNVHDLGENLGQQVMDSLYEAVWGNDFVQNRSDPDGASTLQDVPGRQVTDCGNDVLFMDPLLQTVVVSGIGTTVYEPGRLGRSALVDAEYQGLPDAPWYCPNPVCRGSPYRQTGELQPTTDPAPERVHVRGQLLSIDLGGDDVYRNNAGGSFLSLLLPDKDGLTTVQYPTEETPLFGGTTIPPESSPSTLEVEVEPSSVAVALDLGGDDVYEPPSVAEAEGERLDSEPHAPYAWYVCGGGHNSDGSCQRSGGFDGNGWPRLEGGVQGDVESEHAPPGEASDQQRPGPPVTDRAIQGASLGGVGVLWDRSGDDRYAAGEQAQGFGGGLLQEQREDMPCFGSVHAVCLLGLMGVGVLADDAGDDAYAALSDAQGAAGPARVDHHVQGTDEAVGDVLDEAEGVTEVEDPRNAAPPVFGGTGVLVDRTGDDRYLLADDGASPGHGYGRAGVGLLVDGRGSDAYGWDAQGGIQAGMQGQGTDAGLGALVDLGGEDSYTRRHAETGHRYGNEECRGTYAAGQTREGQAPGFGVFVDLDPARRCDINPFRTPDAVADHVTREAEWALGTVLGALPDPEASTNDTDGDGWIDAVETLARLEEIEAYGWEEEGEEGEESYPAGFPDESNLPEKPDAWPGPWPFDTYPPDTGPSGSDFVVRVPGVVAIGDATNTTYGPSDGSDDLDVDYPVSGIVKDVPKLVLHDVLMRDADDHLVTVDLGGPDTYQNTVGGFLQLAVDVGEADDTYENENDEGEDGVNCLQGCDGYLLDLGGDDAYAASDYAQGASRLLNGVLFDADGDDVYAAGAWSQGGTEYGFPGPLSLGGLPTTRGSLLLDASGDDTYDAPSQARIDTSIPGGLVKTQWAMAGSSALFLDLDGDDTYQPAGLQGRTTGLAGGGTTGIEHPFVGRSAAFVDNAGQDTYKGMQDTYEGTPSGSRESPDLSEHRNDRLRVGSHIVDRFEVFWDQEPGRTDEDDHEPTQGHLDMPGLGVRIAEDADDNEYKQDYALVLDPSGDDEYANNAGASLLRAHGAVEPDVDEDGSRVVVEQTASVPRPLSVAALVWDGGGNDTYDASDRHRFTGRDVGDGGPPIPFVPTRGQLAQGAGFLGVGVLVDDEDGDDTYTARGLAQGASVLGSGLLWDEGGDDAYRLAPDVALAPSLSEDGQSAAWQAFGGGGTLTGSTGWGVEAWLKPDAVTDSFTWTPTDHPSVPASGTVPPGAADTGAPSADRPSGTSVLDVHAAPQEDWLADGTVLFSAFDGTSSTPSWNAYVAAPDPADGGVDGMDSLVNPDSDWVSNQRHPTVGNEKFPYLWVDDIDGTWSIFAVKAANEDGLGDSRDRDGNRLGPGWERDSNQTHPQITEGEESRWPSDQLIWQDDRDDSWDIFRMHLGNFTTAKVTTTKVSDLGDPGRDHVNPASGGQLLAWETTSADGDDWDVVVYHIQTGQVAVLDGDRGVTCCKDPDDVTFADPSTDRPDRFEPTVSGQRVLFTERDADGDTRVREYQWGDDETTLIPGGARHPDLGPSQPREYALTSTDGRQRDANMRDCVGACATHSPFWEIVRTDADGEHHLSQARADTYSRLMQGASLQGGLGALLDVEGNDAYRGQDFAQGAAMSSGTPRGYTHGLLELEEQEDHGAHGALVDLAGNERYTADRYSQGAHFGRELRVSSSAGVEATENAGVLFDLRGLDQYTANNRSQGASSMVVGSGTVHLTPSSGGEGCSAIHTGVGTCDGGVDTGQPRHNLELTPVLVASAGLLTDLGGDDTYAYSADEQIEHYPETQGVPSLPRCGSRPDVQSLPDAVSGLVEQVEDEIPLSTLCSAADPALSAWDETRSLVATEREEVNQTIEETSPSSTTRAVTERDRDASERDDSVWRQPWHDRRPGEDTSVGAQAGVAVQEEVPGVSAQGVGTTSADGEEALYVVASPGGVGADLSVMDEVSGGLATAVEREEGDGVDVELHAWDPVDEDWKRVDDSGWTDTALERRPILSVNVTPHDEQLQTVLEIEEVELFVDGAFEGYGEEMPDPENACEGKHEEVPWTFCMDWPTHTWAWPDGEYNITTRVHYGLQSVPTRMGYLEANGTVRVDNPPSLEIPQPLTPEVFSPNPYTGEITHDPPDHPSISFDVSPDTHGNTEDATTWVRVEAQSLDDATADPIEVYSDEFDASRPEGIKRIHISDVSWNGTDEDDVPVHGNYTVRVLVNDQKPPSPGGGHPRTNESEQEVRVDAKPPTGGCIHVAGETEDGEKICNPGARPDEFVGLNKGRFDTNEEGKTKIELIGDPGDEIRQAHVFSSHYENGAWGDWEINESLELNAGETERGGSFVTDHGDWTRLLVLFEDSSGNLECMPTCDPSLPALGAMAPEGESPPEVVKAVQSKMDSQGDGQGDGAYATFFSDFEPPKLSAPGGEYVVNGERLERGGERGLERVGPNDTLKLSFELEEQEPTTATSRDPQGSILWSGDGFGFEEIDLGDHASLNNITCIREDQGLCTKYNVTWNGWSRLNAQLEKIGHEDTDLRWEATVEDLGGNEAKLNNNEATFTLDSTAPGVLDANAHYWTGTTVSKPGDGDDGQDNRVTLEVQAQDRCLACTFPQHRSLEVTVDVAAVTADGEDELVLGTDSQRTTSQDASFIGHLDVTTHDFPRSGIKRIDLPVTVTDKANNTAETTIPLILGSPELGLAHEESTVGETTAQIVWTTTDNTTATLRYGADDLDHTVESPEGTRHVFDLNALDRSTRYEYEVLARDVNASDITSEGTDSFPTHAGLDADLARLGEAPIGSNDGEEVLLSGVEPLVITASVAADGDAEPLVEVTVHNDSLPGGERLLVEERTREGRLEKDVITSALPDGEYEIQINVTHQSPVQEERKQLRVENVVLDNTAPTITPARPAPNTTIAGGADAWTFRVEDELSAVDAASTTVRVNGNAVGSADATFVPDDFSVTRGLLHLRSVPTLPSGDVRLSLAVADAAGNTGVASLPLENDPDAPRPDQAAPSPGVRVDYPGDRSAAQPGDHIRLVAALDDATGVAGAWVNATPLGGAEELQLQREAGEHVAHLTVPPDVNRSVTLTVTTEDELGNRGRTWVHVAVDADPPTIADWEAVATTDNTALFRVETDEPVQAMVELSGADGTVLEGEDASLEQAAMLLEGGFAEAECRQALETARTDGRLAALADVWTACEGLLGALEDKVFPSVLRVTGLEPGASYDVSIQASDGAGWSDRAEATWRFAPVVVDPPALTDVFVREMAEDRLRLNWSVAEDVPDGAVRYDVYRATGDRFQPVVTTMASSLDDTVEPGQPYTYYVQAENLEGASGPPSPTVDIATEPDPAIASVDVTPTRGTPETTFTFQAIVEHAASPHPDVWLVFDDGTTRSLSPAEEGADCREACRLETTTTLPALDLETPDHAFHVEVADQSQMLREPAEGEHSGPTVLAGSGSPAGPQAAEDPPRSVPGPGLAALVAMLGAAWMLTRRRDQR